MENKDYDTLTCFNSIFSKKAFTDEKLSAGFIRWAKKNNALNSDVWLIPVNHTSDRSLKHWAFIVVLLNHKSLVYLNSLHLNPPESVTASICTLLEQLLKKKCQINEWTLYIPKDIPLQKESICAFSSVNGQFQ